MPALINSLITQKTAEKPEEDILCYVSSLLIFNISFLIFVPHRSSTFIFQSSLSIFLGFYFFLPLPICSSASFPSHLSSRCTRPSEYSRIYIYRMQTRKDV